MMVDRYPNLKEKVGGSIPSYEPLYLTKSCQVLNCLLCFDTDLSSFYLKWKVKRENRKKKKKKKKDGYIGVVTNKDFLQVQRLWHHHEPELECEI